MLHHGSRVQKRAHRSVRSTSCDAREQSVVGTISIGKRSVCLPFPAQELIIMAETNPEHARGLPPRGNEPSATVLTQDVLRSDVHRDDCAGRSAKSKKRARAIGNGRLKITEHT